MNRRFRGMIPAIHALATTMVAAATFAGGVIARPPRAHAQELVAQWIFSNNINSANPLAGTSVVPEVTPGSLRIGPNLAAVSWPNGFVAQGWPMGALDTAKYFEFSVSANPGHVLDFDSASFSLFNNSTGNSSWQIRSSVDNFTAALDGGTVTDIVADGEPVFADLSDLPPRTGTVTFRLYTFANSGMNPQQRGLRGSMSGGLDLNLHATVHSSVATWSLNGNLDSGVPRSAGTVLQGAAASDLAGVGLAGTVHLNAFLTGGWPTGARDLSKYLEFAVTASSSYEVLYQYILFSLYHPFGGSSSWELRSSADGFALAIASGTAVGLTGVGVPIAADVSALGQRPGTVTFRLYTYTNIGLPPADQRGLRGSLGGGQDLLVVGDVVQTAPLVFTVSGNFRYQDRLWDQSGFTGGTQDLPARYCDVEIVRPMTETILGSGSTDADGNFAIEIEAYASLVDVYARVLSSTGLHPVYHIDVSPNGDGAVLHSVPTLPVLGHDATTPLDLGSWVLEDTDGTGAPQAFHILDCGVDAWDWLAQPQAMGVFPSLAQTLHFRWSPAGTSGGSFYNGQYVNIASPGSGDTDGWADAVILHEVGHWVADHFHQDDNPGGTHFIGDVFQDPRLSYGEGYATFFCGEVRQHRASVRPGSDSGVSLYADLAIPPAVGTAGGLEFAYDFETSLYGNGTPIGQIGQACETSVTSALWDLVDGPTTPDLTPGDDDEVLDDDSSHVWPVLLSYMASLPDAEQITLEDFVIGWFAVNGPGFQAAAIDQVMNGVNLMGFEDDAQEEDDSFFAATTATLQTYALIGTGGGVVINEVELGAEDAVELYNSSNTAVNLAGWSIVTSTNTTGSDPNLTFTFPVYVLGPGAFVLVRERGSAVNNTDLDLYGGTFSIPWSNGTPGACTLRNAAATPVDFLRWDGSGNASTTPVPAGLSWTGNLGSPPAGLTLQRDSSGVDTDGAGDFVAASASGTQPNLLGGSAHTLYDVGDRDWIRLPLTEGNLYSVRTFALFGAADTFLELLRPDGTTLITSNDDRGAVLPESRLTFIAPSTGEFFARVTQVGQFTRYGMYELRAFQHPSSDLMLPPSGVAAQAQNGSSTADPVLLSWLNGSTYDEVQVEIHGPTPLSRTLGGSVSQLAVALDQGVHTIDVSGVRNGTATAAASSWIYAGLMPLSYADGFENAALPDWGRQVTWATTATLAAEGARAATDSPAGDYVDNLDTSLELRVPVQLGAAGVLSFRHICMTEADFDFGHVEISGDEGATWTELGAYDMSSYGQWADGIADAGDFVSESFSLAAYVGQRVRVRFRLMSDAFVVADGWYIDDIAITSDLVTDVPQHVPVSFALEQNQPNPFNPRTSIGFALPEPARVRLRIYDSRGRLVRGLVDEARPAGTFHEIWDGTDDRGQRLASGVYHYRLEAGAFASSRKLALVE